MLLVFKHGLKISEAGGSNAWTCGQSFSEIVVSNPSEGTDLTLSLVSVLCCQVEVYASGWSLPPSVVCLSVILEPNNDGALAHVGC
jgi:hypothetical protein